MQHINVPEQFSRHPAGRYLSDGPYNGELFRKNFLEPVVKKGTRVTVYLDGGRGYGSSFLEEAFGGLVRLGYSPEQVLALISLVSKDTSLIREINKFIKEARNKEDDKANARRATAK
ncbi:STAS-like domain-containing protein [Stutzerimonas chloritidismutans]|uniref:STAS-like domain-containing protein n=1 Tax=Stutzerimonas chloritidismutans TaxID=203192 RepID=UPI0028AFD9D6|nr:STAS-like domain-containing protein [Stutzerimonas chloritidismutans]